MRIIEGFSLRSISGHISWTMSLNQLKKDALRIFRAGIKAADPVRAVKQHVRRENDRLSVGSRGYDLKDYENVLVIGAGKAAAAMAQPVEELLGDRLKTGLVSVKSGYSLPLKTVQVIEAGHPVPDEAGLNGAGQIVQLLKQTGKKDLVIFLISGGGSALLPMPAEGLTLEDKQQLTRCLLECGATIHEINTLRKHLSRIKGGRLARLAYPSQLVSLILSDVIGDDLDIIASGPTVPDRSTYSDCLAVLDRYGIREKIPPPVLSHLERGARGEIEETPKEGDLAFQKTQNLIVAGNIQAALAAREKAGELGYNSLILSTLIEGETREIARAHTAIAREIRKSGNPLSPPACIVSGGETTVTVRGQGLGGRNQEFALAAAVEIDGWEGVVILSAGTDGTDGPTDAAGAIADGTTLQRAREKGLNAELHLRENDSYPFFQFLGDLIITGPTYTNVMDLRLVMVE